MNAARRSIATTDHSACQGAEVTVIGGGIGGLTAAIALAQRGAEVTVLEQAPELREVGAGIQITPNGAAPLKALGLDARLSEIGLRAAAVEPMDALHGTRIARFDLSRLSGEPYRFVHRADLIAALARAARSAGVEIRTGVRIDAVGEDHLILPETGRMTPDVIIGADGLKSVCRPYLNGDDDAFFTGQVAWRAVIDQPASEPVARVWMAPRQHAVSYPLPGGRMNIVAVQERQQWAKEGWTHEDDPGNLRHAFHGLSGRLTGLLDKVERVGLWGLFRHPVAPRWHGGRLALLGDAAHPTLPFLAQGANLAIEDAYVLAACLGREGQIDTALARYQALRRDRVRRAIAEANANAVRYHLSGLPRYVAQRGLWALGKVAPRAFLGRMSWLYGHDVTRD